MHEAFSLGLACVEVSATLRHDKSQKRIQLVPLPLGSDSFLNVEYQV